MKTKHDYTELDAAIFARIGDAGRPMGFHAIFDCNSVDRLSRCHASTDDAKRSGKPAWRFVDARLQALRKAGKIKSTPAGWVIA